MIYKSKDLIFDKKQGAYTLPIWVLDTDTQTVTHINSKTLETEHFTFHSDHIRYHLHFCDENNSERLQKLVDSGKIYSYLDNLDIRIADALCEQAEIFMNESMEYKTALEKGDLYTVGELGNMCRERAKESVYASMVYV